MGTLSDFRAFVQGRGQVLRQVERALAERQSRYETFFQAVSRARDHELDQLTAHLAEGGMQVPAWLREALDTAQAEVGRTYDAQVAAVRKDCVAAEELSRELQARGAARRTDIQQHNVALDAQEERLKARAAELLRGIEGYNLRVRELSGGFGFFLNFFQMKKLQEVGRALREKQADVAARIEDLRRQWEASLGEHSEEERRLEAQWLDLQKTQAAARTRLEALETERPRVVLRSSVDRALRSRAPAHAQAPAPTQQACPTCRWKSPGTHHFCAICGTRLHADRTDFEGSLEELAELNGHFVRFAEGMQACQQILGLVRGLVSGHDNFLKSVEGMIHTEESCPVAKLQITVPAASVAFGQRFEPLHDLATAVATQPPLEFARRVQALAAQALAADAIQGYFETMGRELSRCAGAQWR